MASTEGVRKNNTMSDLNLIIIGTKKQLHKRQPRPRPIVYNDIDDLDFDYNDIERFYEEFYGPDNFRIFSWPDMD